MKKHNILYTNEYNNINFDCPLKEYPFPQFRRDSYFSLNGKWKYKISNDINNTDDIINDILVPFPIESILSSVNKSLNENEYIIYKKEFTVPNEFIKKNTFINFIGVDQSFILIINKHKFDEITPLCLPTKIDISQYIKENNELIVIVKDNLDYTIPTGKQSKKPKGIFYTPFSGIYFPVYLESFDDNYINQIQIDTTIDTLTLNIDSKSNKFNITIKDKEKIVYQNIIHDKQFVYKFDEPINWSTNNPHLYDLIIETETDKIYSYFGLREFKINNNKFYLNNKEIFLNGVLSQGYYPEGIVTTPTYDLIEYDIKTIKELGFNTLREHIKVEIPYFYYLCDKYGIIVLQDFVNNGKYNFLFLTALPTIGIQKINDKYLNNNKTQRNNFIDCGEKLIKHLYNHPCIIGYTIFNEGWGQFDSDNVYQHFKNKYPNLIFDTTSGWFTRNKSDIISKHWYFNNLKKLEKVKDPVFLSEFGALCYKYKGNNYSEKNVFAYTYFDSIKELEKAYIDLFENKIIPYKHNLNGCIYTQLSDIEEEDNGLLTYDRKILKIHKDIIKDINNKLTN